MKLGTHPARLLKYLVFCEERNTEEEGSGEGTSSPSPVPFCKTFTVMLHRMHHII